MFAEGEGVERLVEGAAGGAPDADEGAEEVAAPLAEGAGLVAEGGGEELDLEAGDAAKAPIGGGSRKPAERNKEDAGLPQAAAEGV
ncbi:MAG: hypothetical protein ABSD27_06745 [Bryobacteraceae bacterium]